MEENKTPEHEVRRRGIDSSEFGLTALFPVLVMLITAVVKHWELDVEPTELAAMFLSIGGAIATYVHSRGQVKKSRNEASAAVAAAEAAQPAAKEAPQVVVGGSITGNTQPTAPAATYELQDDDEVTPFAPPTAL